MSGANTIIKRVSAGVLVTGLMVASIPAWAADFGGDCCADLEERIAELEITTARKGNRKVSLSVYGQVNTAVMFWDNGEEANAYVVDADTESTRFGFAGQARITHDWTAGFRLEVETQAPASNVVSEDNDDGVLTSENGFFSIRNAEWFLRSNTYGRLLVGQGDMASASVVEIDLSGTNVVAKSGYDDFGGGLNIGGITGSRNWDTVAFGNQEFDRQNRVRYDTPIFGGFIASAALGEDDQWDVALRYAGAVGPFRIAVGVSYGEDTDQPAFIDSEMTVGGSGSVVHVPTGLFVTAGGSFRERTFNDALIANTDRDFWFVRGGISQRPFRIGDTTIYGEYAEFNQFDGSEAVVLGAGLVQDVRAAAMQLYVGYRHFEADVTDQFAEQDLDVVVTGARIQF